MKYEVYIYTDICHEYRKIIEMTTESVSLSNPIFDKICNHIANSYPNSCVLWIDKIVNDTLLARYNSKKEMMQEKYPDEFQELELFHGTNEHAIASIVNDGFKSDLNVRSVYGKGNYFAKFASYSKLFMISNREITFMFLCDVLVGKKKLSSQILGACECYVNNLENPDIFAIPEDDAIYPRYVIAFHKNAPS